MQMINRNEIVFEFMCVGVECRQPKKNFLFLFSRYSNDIDAINRNSS